MNQQIKLIGTLLKIIYNFVTLIKMKKIRMSFESQYPTEYDKYFKEIEIERVPVKGDKMSFRIDNDKDFEEFVVTNVEFLFDCGIEQYVEVTVWRRTDHAKERVLIFESQVNMDYL